MSPRVLFGGAVALILLGIYVYLVVYAIKIVSCIAAGSTCSNGLTAADFNLAMAGTLATIGALVSALVIAELAITKPGETPAARVLSADRSAVAAKGLKVVTFVYLSIWLATGVTALVYGSLQHPDTLKPLSDMGQSWLGIAIAAVYAYLGIDPNR